MPPGNSAAEDGPPDARRQMGVNAHWQRNLAVCVIGSFTTLVSMTLLLPFLPLYVEQLGVTTHAGIVQWSSVAFSATFLAAGLVAPVWGMLADRYGRKIMLVRASLGMAVATSLIGMAQNVWQLVGLRAFAGLAGGYSSGSTILVATQTPRERCGWALGVLSSGIMAGNLVGPLVGGVLPPLIGIRGTFWLSGGVIFLTFLATALLIKEEKRPAHERKAAQRIGWSAIPHRRRVVAMLATGLLLMLAIMSIEPILTVYVSQIIGDRSHLTLISGIVMSASALGSILSASKLGAIADRIGHSTVIVGGLAACALLLVPQAFVTAAWQLIVLRFAMGLALGGLLPCITSVIRYNVPDGIASQVLGYSTASQFAGQVAGPLLGGFIGAHIGLRAVFLCTSALMALGAVNVWLARAERNRDREER